MSLTPKLVKLESREVHVVLGMRGARPGDNRSTLSAGITVQKKSQERDALFEFQ